MRAVLIAPTALDFNGDPVRQARVHLPGLTLSMLAAVTPPSVDLRLVYETVEDVPFDEPWDLVGLTGMGSGLFRAWQIADEFRRRGRRVVIGGIAASLVDPELTLQHADAIVLGEAEETWPRVLEDAAAGRLQRVYRAGDPPDIASLPVPRYDLMDGARFGWWRPVQATRGCPFPCRFCSIAAFFRRTYRKRPVEAVLRDVHEAKRNGARAIAFIDDNIAVDFDWSAELFRALIPEKIVWISQCSLHIAERPDLLSLARRSGCQLLSFGIESTNEASLAAMHKEWNRPDRYAEAVRTIRRHGIEVSTEMILGLDADDGSVFERTYDFLMANRIAVPRVHIMTPIPGTPLYDELETDGRILSRDFSRYSGGKVVYRPRRISAEDLQAGYWKLYERLFTWRGIVRRVRRNPAKVGPLVRALTFGVNLHYRNHIRRRICPGIV
jgi:radical SAM superfamily enzyme YgiQ (UPF0313 family)